MRALLAVLFLVPVLAVAAPSVLVDAIPSVGIFFNYAMVQVPIPDLEKANPREIEAGLAAAISNVVPFAEKNGVTHICVLSAAGDSPRSFNIEGTNAKLGLQTKNPWFVIVLYREGHDQPNQPAYSLERPESNREVTIIRIRKVSVPDGWSSTAWLYFNLPRIQAAASKVGAQQVFLRVSGKGATSPVVIPGVKEPLPLPSDETEISAMWYLGQGKAPDHTVELELNKAAARSSP